VPRSNQPAGCERYRVQPHRVPAAPGITRAVRHLQGGRVPQHLSSCNRHHHGKHGMLEVPVCICLYASLDWQQGRRVPQYVPICNRHHHGECSMLRHWLVLSLLMCFGKCQLLSAAWNAGASTRARLTHASPTVSAACCSTGTQVSDLMRMRVCYSTVQPPPPLRQASQLQAQRAAYRLALLLQVCLCIASLSNPCCGTVSIDGTKGRAQMHTCNNTSSLYADCTIGIDEANVLTPVQLQQASLD
jgi:hypothetical protein